MEMSAKDKRQYRQIRARRTRAHLRGSRGTLVRLSVFRSSKHVYAQVIDDQSSKTIVQASDMALKKTKGLTMIQRAEKVGESIAALAKEKKIKKIVFDRGGYRFHGVVKAVAEGARKGGLEF
jgi:large subunit ribosomal protein L18